MSRRLNSVSTLNWSNCILAVMAVCSACHEDEIYLCCEVLSWIVIVIWRSELDEENNFGTETDFHFVEKRYASLKQYTNLSIQYTVNYFRIEIRCVLAPTVVVIIKTANRMKSEQIWMISSRILTPHPLSHTTRSIFNLFNIPAATVGDNFIPLICLGIICISVCSNVQLPYQHQSNRPMTISIDRRSLSSLRTPDS